MYCKKRKWHTRFNGAFLSENRASARPLLHSLQNAFFSKLPAYESILPLTVLNPNILFYFRQALGRVQRPRANFDPWSDRHGNPGPWFVRQQPTDSSTRGEDECHPVIVFINVAIPLQVFARHGLVNLQKLYLSNCSIGQIDPTAFRGLTNLVELNLARNLLTSVPTATFAGKFK